MVRAVFLAIQQIIGNFPKNDTEQKLGHYYPNDAKKDTEKQGNC